MLAAFGKSLRFDGGDNDNVPVVELRPFMAQQWMPSKSLPDTMERSLTTISMTPQQKTTQRAPRQSMPVVRVNYERLESPDRHMVPRTPRVKETKHNNVLLREKSFAPNSDRERSTLNEINTSYSANKEYSFLRPAVSELDLSRQQEIQISGRSMDSKPPELNLLYSTHWQYYKVPKKYDVPEAQQTVEEINDRIESIQNSYMDNAIYDTFDRSNTLPSLSVAHAPMKIRKNRQEYTSRQPSAKVIRKQGYQLGVVNSLDVLSHYGQPVRFEKHLTKELKQTLKHVRKNKENMLGVSSGFRYGGSLARYETKQTPGENYLRKEHHASTTDDFKGGEHTRNSKTSGSLRSWPGQNGRVVRDEDTRWKIANESNWGSESVTSAGHTYARRQAGGMIYPRFAVSHRGTTLPNLSASSVARSAQEDSVVDTSNGSVSAGSTIASDAEAMNSYNHKRSKLPMKSGRQMHRINELSQRSPTKLTPGSSEFLSAKGVRIDSTPASISSAEENAVGIKTENSSNGDCEIEYSRDKTSTGRIPSAPQSSPKLQQDHVPSDVNKPEQKLTSNNTESIKVEKPDNNASELNVGNEEKEEPVMAREEQSNQDKDIGKQTTSKINNEEQNEPDEGNGKQDADTTEQEEPDADNMEQDTSMTDKKEHDTRETVVNETKNEPDIIDKNSANRDQTET